MAKKDGKMTYRLDGKVVCITGASSGIGEACAIACAAAGARLILSARRLDRLANLASQLQVQYGTQSHLIKLDVTDCNAVKTAFSSLPSGFQYIDVLVNNAGLAAGLDPIVSANLSDWEAMIDTNIKGLMYVTKQVMPIMLARKEGHIVNIGSIAGHQAYAGGSVYCATKHAVKALSRAMKLEANGTMLRVTEVDPGMVETEFSLVRFKGDAQRAAKVYSGLKPMTGEDIADAVLYAITRPSHVNVSEITLTTTAQSMQLV